MAMSYGSAEGCRHDRAPLRRLGKIAHQRTGKAVYVLLCTECGFTVTTEQLRRLRRGGSDGPSETLGCHVPRWASELRYYPHG